MLQKITFKQYKAFAEEETLELRPITLLVGKNSSGKSSVCKLLSMAACALSANFSELLPLKCGRSEEHTSELQSLKRISYAVSLFGRAHV